MTEIRKTPLELYLHIPFCAKKCNYCDFLSFRCLVSDQEAYMAQLEAEIRAQGSLYGGYQVVSIFIGGGTPSILEPDLIRSVMETVFRSFDVSREAEITIEANPGTLLGRKLPVYHACGINRVSIGLQSASNEELRCLGRIHSFEDFLKSFQYARMAGFSNISVDLMSGIPGQTMDSWKNTLKKVTMLKPEHISAYSLIIEEGTPFWERYGAGQGKGADRLEADQTGAGRFEVRQPATGGYPSAPWPPLPEEDLEYSIYQYTRTFLAEQGYERYEISNYARPGHQCRHNIGYWTETSYLGLGLGASSYVGGCRFANEVDFRTYMGLDFSPEAAEGSLKLLHGQINRLSRQECMEEFMFLGLRMLQGISELDFVATFGVKLEHVYGPVLRRLVEEGLMKQEGVRYALTERGLDVSNQVLSEFLLS